MLGIRLPRISCYKVIFTAVFVFNWAAFAALVQRVQLDRSHALLGVAVNILLTILARQEEIVTFWFWLCTRAPLNTPLVIRSHLANVYHYGGVHSGSAVSATSWYILYIAFSTELCLKKGFTRFEHVAIILGYLFLLFLLFIIVTALPRPRRYFHNVFERTHRFAGWASLAVLWVHAPIDTIAAHERGTEINILQSLKANPCIWILSVTTFFVALPWLRIRRVPVVAHKLSNHALKLTFPYNHMPYCRVQRFSTSALLEWHSFATIPSPTSREQASIVISAAGDWTRAMIANPPTHIWLRKPPTPNFFYCSRLFKSILLVATGTGIGPCLSLLATKDRPPICVIWSARAPEQTYGKSIVKAVKMGDPYANIRDSAIHGRANLVEEVLTKLEIVPCEAVFVVSNKGVTDSLTRELKDRGLTSVYGAIFDS